MDFDLPAGLVAYLAELDDFIEREIKPLEEADDNIASSTTAANGRAPISTTVAAAPRMGSPAPKAPRRADAAGHCASRPRRYGGSDGSNLWMAVIREHFAAKGLGLHNDLQTEHSIVGNNPFVLLFDTSAPAQHAIIAGLLTNATPCLRPHRARARLGRHVHGDHARCRRRATASGWRIDGEKMWTTGMHVATHCALFARTGQRWRCARHHRFLVPALRRG